MDIAMKNSGAKSRKRKLLFPCCLAIAKISEDSNEALEEGKLIRLLKGSDWRSGRG